MKRLTLIALLLAAPAFAQAPGTIGRATLAAIWDLDGEAADANQVIAATALVDDGTSVADADWTILAQPDTCRLIDATIVDTNLDVGSLTVVGTDCLGRAKSCAFAFTVGDDTGVVTLTCDDSFGAYYSSIATVTTGTMTGESDETFELGYTSNSVNGWPMYGKLIPSDADGRWGVDPFGFDEIGFRITTAGALSTTVTGVLAADDAFDRASAGDIIVVSIAGQSFERLITAKASADSVTINNALNIPAVGVGYRLKKFYFSTNPDDLMLVPVHGYRTAMFDWSVDANVSTGGVVTLVECTADQVEFPASARWVVIDTTTTASAGAQVSISELINLETSPYAYCRFGARLGTGDDGDGAPEDINIAFTLMK